MGCVFKRITSERKKDRCEATLYIIGVVEFMVYPRAAAHTVFRPMSYGCEM
jgi:hypothetical protein